ncbi:MAG: hypothetical protein LBL47_02280 [Lactobacillus sp.]|jgi:hypothetical protein|nr:hypothetical protein [Lactobacillus sp.]
MKKVFSVLSILFSFAAAEASASYFDYTFTKNDELQNQSTLTERTSDTTIASLLKGNQVLTSGKTLSTSGMFYEFKSESGIKTISGNFSGDMFTVNGVDVYFDQVSLEHAKNKTGRAVTAIDGGLGIAYANVKNNETWNNSSGGGAIYLENSDIVSNRVTYEGNASAYRDGGVGNLTTSSATINDSAGKHAAGGAIRSYYDDTASGPVSANFDEWNTFKKNTAWAGDAQSYTLCSGVGCWGTLNGNANLADGGMAAGAAIYVTNNHSTERTEWTFGHVIDTGGLDLGLPKDYGKNSTTTFTQNVTQAGYGGELGLYSTPDDSFIISTGKGGSATGGAIYGDGKIDFDFEGNAVFEKNTAYSGYGGGVYSFYDVDYLKGVISIGSGGTVSGSVIKLQNGATMNFTKNATFTSNVAVAGNGGVIEASNISLSSTGSSNIASGNGGNVEGGVLIAIASSYSFEGNTTFTGNKVTSGNGGAFASYIGNEYFGSNYDSMNSYSKTYMSGNGGAIYGGVIAAQAAPLSFDGPVLIKSNVITTGNGGDVTIGAGPVGLGIGGSVYGGILYLSSIGTDLLATNTFAIENNTVKIGKSGKIKKTGTTTAVEVLGYSNYTAVSGGLIQISTGATAVFEGGLSLKNNKVAMTNMDAISINAGGILGNSQGDVSGGFVNVSNSALSVGLSSKPEDRLSIVFDGSQLTMGNTGNVTVTKGSDAATATYDRAISSGNMGGIQGGALSARYSTIDFYDQASFKNVKIQRGNTGVTTNIQAGAYSGSMGDIYSPKLPLDT